MAMSEAYLRAMAQSYANQIGIVTISTADLDRIIEIPLGFQPVWIAAQPTESGDRIAIAAYYEPAICLADVTRDETGLHFAVSWVRGVNHGIQSVRLFPDFFQNEPNRLQSVNFGPEGTLLRSIQSTRPRRLSRSVSLNLQPRPFLRLRRIL